MTSLIKVGLSILSMGLLLGACGPSMGPKVRVATASAAELQAVEDADNVWYEFQPGDVIPVQLGFLGAFEGGGEQPAVFRAKQHFYFVMFKNAPMQISFDGSTFAGPNGSQSLIAVVPRKDNQGGQLGWVIYMGESGDPKAELQKLVESSKTTARSKTRATAVE
jgi:hypothetical protein